MSGDRRSSEGPDGALAIDLSRRKEPWRRHVLAEAGRAAAPYVTTTRIAVAALSRSRPARVGALVLAMLSLVAIFADLLASELPILCRHDGVLYVLPNVTHPAALADVTCAREAKAHAPGDWTVPPLVAHGPTEAGQESDILRPPLTPGHPFGTDALGRDVFARLVHGTRTALGVGLGASAVLVLLGVALGGSAGFAGGLVDSIVTRLVESLTAIPTLVLVLVVAGIVQHPTTATLLWTLALTRWTDLARLVRAEVLLTLGNDYVTAARALGATPARVLSRHVLPNAVGPAIVAATFGIASVVLMEAAIDFLRAGSPDTMASWGETLGEARSHWGAWWLVAFPSGALVVTLAALNLLGDAARDALDPMQRDATAGLADGVGGAPP